MARINVDAWLPEEPTSEVVTRVGQTSAAEKLFRRIPMSSFTKSIPRSGAASVEVIPKGGTYGEDSASNDEAILTARKFGKLFRLADEDIQDNVVDALGAKKIEWAFSYAKMLDNATLGVTAAENGGTIPFTSVRNAIGATVTSATGVAVTYANLSAVFGVVETGDFFDPNRLVVIAHPGYRAKLRDILDTQGRPVFVENPRLGDPDTLYGAPVTWSLGARESAVATDTPTGNQLLIVANADYLALGIRSGPESMVSDPNTGVAMTSDEALLKIRARRGFQVLRTGAAAVLVDVP